MKTSLNRVKEIEDFLLRNGSAGRVLLFRAKLIIDPLLGNETAAQNATYSMIKQYGRRRNRRLLDAAYDRFMCNPSLAGKIRKLFKNGIQ